MFAHLTELLVDVVVAYTQALNNVTRAGTFRSLLLPRNAAEVSVQGGDTRNCRYPETSYDSSVCTTFVLCLVLFELVA